MTSALLVLSLAILGGYIILFAEAALRRGSIHSVEDAPPLDEAPRVTLVLAARNEARHIEAAVRSHLAQDYPALRIVAVNDRSEDGTGAILDRLASEDDRIGVVHVTSLPEGWLGKNHALHLGSDSADGEWLLFTDADVVFHGDVIRRAVAIARRENADHVALAPQITGGTLPTRIFVSGFSFFFAIHSRPWRASDPRTKDAIGIGAFNLVRRTALEQVGRFEPIRLRPDDDMMLARVLKRAGFRNLFVQSDGMIEVEWYPTLRSAIDGLMKNAFATVEYSLARLIAASSMLFLGVVWPFVAIAVTAGATWYANAATCILILAAAITGIRQARQPVWHAALVPVTSLLFLWILWRSALITLRDGGVTWRGTLYPLDALRANRIR